MLEVFFCYSAFLRAGKVSRLTITMRPCPALTLSAVMVRDALSI